MDIALEGMIRAAGAISRAAGKLLKGSEETSWLADFWLGNYTNLKEDEDLADLSALLVQIGGLRVELREQIGDRPNVEVQDLEWIKDQLFGPTRYC